MRKSAWSTGRFNIGPAAAMQSRPPFTRHNIIVYRRAHSPIWSIWNGSISVTTAFARWRHIRSTDQHYNISSSTGTATSVLFRTRSLASRRQDSTSTTAPCPPWTRSCSVPSTRRSATSGWTAMSWRPLIDSWRDCSGFCLIYDWVRTRYTAAVNCHG